MYVCVADIFSLWSFSMFFFFLISCKYTAVENSGFSKNFVLSNTTDEILK